MNDAVVIWSLVVCGFLVAAVVAGLVVVVLRLAEQNERHTRRAQDLFCEMAGTELKVKGFEVQEKAIEAAIRIGAPPTPSGGAPAQREEQPILRPTMPRDEEPAAAMPTL